MKGRSIRISRYVMLILVCSLLLSGTALAAYPTKPIRLIVPYSAGGASDLTARALAPRLSHYLGQPVIVQNMAGAGGFVGSAYVERADPDGYTMLLARIGSQAIGPATNPDSPYEYDDFAVVGLLDRNPFVFVVNADSPYKTFSDLVNALKNNPGKLSYSTSGPATSLNMGTQLLLASIGLGPKAARQIQYRGGGEAATAVLGGHVDFVGINLVSVESGIKGGLLRALAVTTEERVPSIPDVPTVGELGFPKLEQIQGWSAIYGPPGLPKSVVQVWVKALQELSRDKKWLQAEARLGSIPDVRLPEETRKFVTKQFKLYKRLDERISAAD